MGRSRKDLFRTGLQAFTGPQPRKGICAMMLERVPFDLTVCKIPSVSDINLDTGFFFLAKTEEELSLVCRSSDTPSRATVRDDGWKGFRIKGQLNLSLIGILSKLTSVLAENKIGVFAVSTYNTDYILVKEKDCQRAAQALEQAGYTIED